MSRVIIVAIKDKITGEFMTPMYVHNQEEAARLFKYNLEHTQLWKENAEQFEMHNLGILDTQTGNIISCLPDKTTGDIHTIHPDMIYKGTDIIDKEGE